MSDGVDDLLREIDDPQEQERLRKVHDLLLSVDPPPSVPPTLRATPPEQPVQLRPRRRRAVLVALAAALAALAFGAGYWVGDRGEDPAFVVDMHGTADRSAAVASIEILDEDKAGNWPMDVVVRGLEPSQDRQDAPALTVTIPPT